ncbi:MAG: 30S ribosomal protein THX [Bacteroidales bacterium]|nr:30S ribosomal protein THX [Bacteroidales bacterium]
MGKGDQKSKRGKIIAGSYGNNRSHKAPKPAAKETSEE